ncbi:unnamed protein product [Cylicocyclus nassatus]|uniref:Uncharacterized protein n=1 Tax=Cylicocyclus nassatus TaxID=53992 RepID=A0AA36DPZ0_CYLNA|nr:unnamed protein product [Cylicocyclus nassatus]
MPKRGFFNDVLESGAARLIFQKDEGILMVLIKAQLELDALLEANKDDDLARMHLYVVESPPLVKEPSVQKDENSLPQESETPNFTDLDFSACKVCSEKASPK